MFVQVPQCAGIVRSTHSPLHMIAVELSHAMPDSSAPSYPVVPSSDVSGPSEGTASDGEESNGEEPSALASGGSQILNPASSKWQIQPAGGGQVLASEHSTLAQPLAKAPRQEAVGSEKAIHVHEVRIGRSSST